MERGPTPCLPPPCRLISISLLLFQLPFPLDHRGWLSLIARTSGAESNGRLLPPGPQRGGTELSRPWDRTALGVGRATGHIPVSPTSFSSPGSLEPLPPLTLQRKTSYTHNGILFSCKKEQRTDPCHNTDKNIERMELSKETTLQRPHAVLGRRYKECRTAAVHTDRKQVGGSQGLGRGAGGEAADGHGALPGNDENGWN